MRALPVSGRGRGRSVVTQGSRGLSEGGVFCRLQKLLVLEQKL